MSVFLDNVSWDNISKSLLLFVVRILSYNLYFFIGKQQAAKYWWPPLPKVGQRKTFFSVFDIINVIQKQWLYI